MRLHETTVWPLFAAPTPFPRRARTTLSATHRRGRRKQHVPASWPLHLKRAADAPGLMLTRHRRIVPGVPYPWHSHTTPRAASALAIGNGDDEGRLKPVMRLGT